MATYRRSIILINKSFQLRFAAYVCSWLAAICFIYPLITHNLFDYFIQYATHDPLGPDVASLQATKADVIKLIVLTEAAFLIMTFLICIFMSHRIAGPIYKLRKCLVEIGDGSWKGKLSFRQKDWFPELADDFNRMHEGLSERSHREDELVASAASRIESAMSQVNPEARQELDRALAILRNLRANRAPTRAPEPITTEA